MCMRLSVISSNHRYQSVQKLTRDSSRVVLLVFVSAAKKRDHSCSFARSWPATCDKSSSRAKRIREIRFAQFCPRAGPHSDLEVMMMGLTPCFSSWDT